MFKGKLFSVAVVGLLVIGILSVNAAQSGGQEQKAVMAGMVVAQGLVVPGAVVREGDALVYVESITGATPTARATVDGVVKEVTVKPGDRVKTGDVVATIEATRK